MEPAATSFLVTRDPPPPTKTVHDLGQNQGTAQQGWARRAFPQILCVLLAFAFAWGLRRAGYDFGLSGPATYLLSVLCFCLYKLELLRRDPGGDPAEAARERRRIGLAAWAVSLGLGSTVALHAASAAPSLAPRVALWVLAGLAMVLAFYLVFEARRGDSRTDDAGRWPEKGLHELSPELRV